MREGVDEDWLKVFMSLYKQASPTIEIVASLDSDRKPASPDSLIEGYTVLLPVLQSVKGMTKPSNKEFRTVKANFEKTLEKCIKAGEMASKMTDDLAHGSQHAARMHFSSILLCVINAQAYHNLVKGGLTEIGMNIGDQSGLRSVAEFFAAVAIPKVIEAGGLTRRKYIRLGPLFCGVGGWMFQAGGTLGYGLRDHPVILGKLLGVLGDRADEYVQSTLKEIATRQLAQSFGKDKRLSDVFLFPTLAQSGYELTPAAKWVNTKVHDMQRIWELAQTAFQKGVAVSFHFPKDFQIYWTNTFQSRPQEEWDKFYSMGLVTTQQQDILILEDEVSNTLAAAIDWVRRSAPKQLTPDEMSILEKLTLSKESADRSGKDSRTGI